MSEAICGYLPRMSLRSSGLHRFNNCALWLWLSPGRRLEAASASKHPQRLHIGFQDALLLLALVGILLAQAHDGAQRLHIETVALALGVDVANVVGDGLFLFFQPLDALDDGLELISCKFCRGRFFVDDGRRG